MQRWNRTVVKLVAGAMALGAHAASADVIYESAALGPDGNGGYLVSNKSWLGVQFATSTPRQVRSLRAHLRLEAFQGVSNSTFFFAIVPATPLPVGHSLDTAVFVGLVDVGLSGEAHLDTDFTLPAGSWIFITGCGAAGAATLSGFVGVDPIIGDPQYIFSSSNNGYAWVTGGFTNVRFVVEGFACGDGLISPGEVCDDGNTSNEDPCTAGCVPNVCGDGFANPGVEACDKGAANSDTNAGACRTTCVSAACGDGVIDPLEDCDDGDLNSPDGPCSTTCSDISPTVSSSSGVSAASVSAASVSAVSASGSSAPGSAASGSAASGPGSASTGTGGAGGSADYALINGRACTCSTAGSEGSGGRDGAALALILCGAAALRRDRALRRGAGARP